MKALSCAVIAIMLLGTVRTVSQNSSSASFVLLSGEIPMYPPLALAARIQGAVEVQTTVVQGVVTKADTPANSNQLLAAAAANTVRSWRFGQEQNGLFKVTFSFELAKQEVLRPENPEIELRLPHRVRVIAKPVAPVILR